MKLGQREGGTGDEILNYDTNISELQRKENIKEQSI